MAADLLILDDPRMDLHDPGPGHPERPGRLPAIRRALETLRGRVERCTPEPRPDLAALAGLVHTDAHLALLEGLRGRSARLDPDTAVCPGSVEAAWTAAAAAVKAVDALAAGDAAAALALTRPPGHHAESDRAMGFCLLNNAAIAAAHAVATHGLSRVLIVDWDVHHGNGTQSAFYDRGDVLYFSVHEWPLFPGTGAAVESGRGPGEGRTCNVPLPAGAGDDDYAAVFDEVLLPLAEGFRPELVLVSAGFDAHADDPLGRMLVTAQGFARLCGRVRRIAQRHAGGRVGLVLEGGYAAAALGAGVRACAEVLLDGAAAPTEPGPAAASATVRRVIGAVRSAHPTLAASK